jgi:rod shape-determining protein MreD
MKRWFIILLAVILLATLQLAWPTRLTFFYGRPDLLLIFVIAAVFFLDFRVALVTSILCGLFKDVFLPAGFGLNTILFSISCYTISKLSLQISTEPDIIRLGLVFAAALLNNVISGLVSVNSGALIPAGIFLRSLIIPSVYTAALSPLVFKLAKKITS